MEFWTKSLMARLVSYFLLLSLVIVSLVGYIAFVQAREALKQSVLDQLNAVANLKKDELNHWIDIQRQNVLLTAQLPEVQAQAKVLLSHKESEPEYQAAYVHLSEYLTLIAANKPDLQEIFILTDVGGKIILSTNKSHEGEYQVKASYFIQGRLKTFVQNIYPSPITIKPTMTIATPLLDETGRRLGVLAAHLNLERLDQIVLEGTGLGESGETYLVDKFNVFISGERFGRQEFPLGVHTEGIDAALQGIDGAGLYLNYAGEPVIGVYRWLDDRELALLAEMHQNKAFAPARQLALTIWLVGLVSAGMLVVGVYLLARQIARPILAITDTAIQVAAGDLTPTAPVLTKDEVGVLACTFNSMTARLRETLEGLEQRNQQLSQEVAMRKQAEEENAHLFEAEARRRREAETLHKATQALSTTLNLQEVFELILSELQQVVPYDSASVQQLMGHHLEIIGGHGFPNLDELLGVRFDLTADNNPNQEVIRTRTPLILSDAPALYSEFHEEPHAQADIHSWLGVPMMVGEQIIGMIALDKRKFGFYTEEHARLAQAFAAQAAVVIENARLYEETKRQAGEMTALYHTSLEIGNSTDLAHLLWTICDRAAKLLGVDKGGLYLYDETHQELELVVSYRLKQDLTGLRIKLGEGVAGRVVQTGQPLIVGDYSHWDKRAQVYNGESFAAVLGVPLIWQVQIIGAITLSEETKQRIFTPDDERLLSLFAQQAAIAIENARMFTELKQADQALRESEERYRRLVESSPDAIAVQSQDKIVFINNACVTLFGAETPDQIIGKSVWDFIPPEYRDAARERFQLMREKGIRIPPVEQRYVRLDGTYIDTDVTAVPLTYQDKPAIQAIFRDITERKQAEKALRLSDELLKQMPDAILVTDLEGNIERWLGKAEQIFGYTAEEAVGKPVNFIYRPDIKDAMISKIIQNINETGDFFGEIPCLKKGGDGVPIEITAKMVYDEEGKPLALIGINKDITRRKQFEEQLRQAQKMEAVGQLAGGVAHDFNNILTVIIGNCNLMLTDPNLNDTLRRDVEQIRRVGERAASLTRQLLAFSRRQVLQPEVLNLNEVIANTKKMLTRLISENIDLMTVLEPGLGQVKADPGQIDQVIVNLAINARDAMPQGGKLTIETKNAYLDKTYTREHVGVKPGPYVMLAVSDTGNGIDAETQSRIFEPFFTTKEQGKGTGLGLATVHGIINQSSGHIWVYSELGKGTTFKVYLPRIEEPAETTRRELIPADIPYGSETILLVEDETIVRKLARRILLTRGYTVLQAGQGAEALQVCQKHSGPIHLLVTDVVMPEMSGPELAAYLSHLYPEMKVLYISGYTDNAIVHHGVLDQGTNFLQKPFTPNVLARKVREVLDGETQQERQ